MKGRFWLVVAIAMIVASVAFVAVSITLEWPAHNRTGVNLIASVVGVIGAVGILEHFCGGAR